MLIQQAQHHHVAAAVSHTAAAVNHSSIPHLQDFDEIRSGCVPPVVHRDELRGVYNTAGTFRVLPGVLLGRRAQGCVGGSSEKERLFPERGTRYAVAL